MSRYRFRFGDLTVSPKIKRQNNTSFSNKNAKSIDAKALTKLLS